MSNTLKAKICINGGNSMPANLDAREPFILDDGTTRRLLVGDDNGNVVDVNPYKLSPAQYGTTLPTSNIEVGQVFFLIP